MRAEEHVRFFLAVRFGKVCDFLQEPAAAQPLSQLESGLVTCPWGSNRAVTSTDPLAPSKLKQSGTRAMKASWNCPA